MYFKVSIRKNPATGEPAGYYRLIESYRNADGRVCHRTLLNVGFMDGLEAEDLNRIQKLLNHKCQSLSGEIFRMEYEKETPVIREWVDKLYARLVREKKIDVQSPPPKELLSGRDWQTIDMNSLRHKDVREIGGEWLCYQALEQLGMSNFLSSQVDWFPDDVRLAFTHIISRAVYPASELKTSRWITENSAVCELTGFPMDKITKDSLYSISKRLYSLKDSLEAHLSHRTNDLFDIQDKIIIFDLTNTFFEGEKRGSQLANFGRSKEKRSDAKLVVLALVINPYGFIKYSAILQGNVSDPSTLEAMIKNLREKTSSTAEKGLVVIDAGIATKANLAKIRENGFDYLCVSRSRLKDYKIVEGEDCLVVEDNRKRKIHLQKVVPSILSGEGVDYYLKVESLSKQKKELSMNNRFHDGYRKGLIVIQEGLSKKSGIKNEEKVHERVGRLKEKYPSIHKHYEIEYQVKEQIVGKKKKTVKRIVTAMTWKFKAEVEINAGCGIYFLQTSLDNESRILWDSYNTIRDIEQTFAILKSELDLRPIFHQKDENTMAHLHLAILAYWVVNSIRHQLKETGINHQWNEIVRIMNTQKAITTTAQNKSDEIIQIRRCSEPNDKVKEIYQALKYKSTPFKKKKFVVHKLESKKNEGSYVQTFSKQ
ncbi:MAG: IS1634 family transposase [Tannerella sp.]|jgi:hypothetical protein|nr:IS1634 family transposase [Tannerella sp.]